MLEQEKAIRQVLSGYRKTSHLIPTWQDMEVLESVQAAIGPLADFTDMERSASHSHPRFMMEYVDEVDRNAIRDRLKDEGVDLA